MLTNINANSNREPYHRIEWIDLAKGICICLVVFGHLCLFYWEDCKYEYLIKTFRMPLYFILSGLFFKRYEGIVGFVKRKVNKLLIPYVFFFGITGFLIPCILHFKFGLKIWMYNPQGWSDFFHIFTERPNGNPVIWFLLCLFEVNLIFYFVTSIVDKMEINVRKEFSYGIVSLFFGMMGLWCSYYTIDLPFFLDTALTAVPFFYFGWMLKHSSKILYLRPTYCSTILSIVFIVISLIIVVRFSHLCMPYGFITNNYGGTCAIFMIYPLGIIGTISVFLISILIKKLPLVSYLGRYSIMILVTHWYIIQLLDCLYNIMGLCFSKKYIISTIVTLLAYYAVIPIMKLVTPYVTAQKDVIKV